VKRLSLNIVATGTALMPNRLKRLRISGAAVLVTAAAITDTLVMTVRDGGGNVAARFESPVPSALAQIVTSLAVNGPGNITATVGLVSDLPGFLPPDLWIETEDSVTFSFATAPTSVDSPIIITYQEE